METVNGEFIMKGCNAGDPSALKELNDCRTLIHTIGFIPLFSNAIPGFSVEEHVPASTWWTEDPETDPWVWRMTLAEDDSIAYGKFFNKCAGFISRDFFPVFANYRRNGYDFDALFEDELASYRSKKIMDVFELDDDSVGKEIMSYELKHMAGFGKKDDGQAGEKGFEGVITELQMQTYLIMSRFAQKKNKKGESYGWHIAALESPETKWGRDFVTSSYSEDPKESWEKIKTRIKEHFPEITDADITKILGIRYPGESATVVRKGGSKAKKKPAYERKNERPQELPWPENLITEIGLDRVFPETGVYAPLTEDQMEGMSFAIEELRENERVMLKQRYEEHMTLRAIGAVMDLSPERIRQICAKGVRKLKHPTRLKYIKDGYVGTQLKEQEQKKNLKVSGNREEQVSALKEFRVTDCGLSVRSGNCLSRAGLETLGSAVEFMDSDPLRFIMIRNLGQRSLNEILDKLESYGIDCKVVREKAVEVYLDGKKRR